MEREKNREAVLFLQEMVGDSRRRHSFWMRQMSRMVTALGRDTMLDHSRSERTLVRQHVITLRILQGTYAARVRNHKPRQAVAR